MMIGISGKARSGKDTTAQILVESAPDIFETYSFAKPIKVVCAMLFNWNEDHLYGDLKEVVDPVWGITPRYAKQTLGTDWGRNLINRDIWIKYAEEYSKRYPDKVLVVTDVRFENEADFIRNSGGTIVHIKRQELDQINGVANHESEAGVATKLSDIVITNDGTLEELRLKCDKIVTSVLKERKSSNNS